MIQVTLSFPDQAALVQFFTSVSAAPAPVKVEAPKPAPTPAAPATVTKTAKVTAPAAPAAESPSDPKPEPEATTSSAKPSASVDYPTLQKAVFALAGKSRDKAAAVAATLGVKTFKELPESKWAEALAAVNEALAA